MSWNPIRSKSELAIILSRISGFVNPNHLKEQYMTDSEIAADVLWKAHFLDDIAGRRVADLGCGAGILGIGAALLGCKMVTFVEEDKRSLAIASSNYAKFELEGEMPPAEFEKAEIEEWKPKIYDTIIMNPPFGTRRKHIDRKFLEKAFQSSEIVYSFHKTVTAEFIREYARKNGFRVTHEWNYKFPLKATEMFHTRKIRRIEVTAFRFTKNNREEESITASVEEKS